jgi:spermidine synthase
LNFIYKAEGHVLINGLGLGVCLKAVLEKKEVIKVTVIEKSEDVIKLVAPSFQDDRVEIINADAFEYKPPKGVVYDVVWHDIWQDICTDNLEQMKKLHRKYGRKCKWQGSWSRKLCEYYERKERRYRR